MISAMCFWMVNVYKTNYSGYTVNIVINVCCTVSDKYVGVVSEGDTSHSSVALSQTEA